MKKIYFLALTFIGLSFINAQVVINDGFEDYPIGPYFGGHWSTWSGTSGAESIIVSSDQAADGSKSGYIGGNGTQDAILLFGEGRNSGVWTFKFDMYIDFAGVGYYNVQQKMANLGVEGNWGNQIYFGMTGAATPEYTPGTGYIYGTEFYFPFSYPEETWFEVKMEIDLDNGGVRFFIDGTEIDTAGNNIGYPGGAGGFLEGADFYSADASNSFYIDNVVFTEGQLGVDDISAENILLYPTVIKDSFTVSAKTNISEIMIFNTLGQQLMKVSPNGISSQISVNSLPAGVYVVRIKTGKEILTKKIIVK